MTVPVSASGMDCADCACVNGAFNVEPKVQLVDGTGFRAIYYRHCPASTVSIIPLPVLLPAEGRGRDSLGTNIYPDSPGLTCVSSVSSSAVGFCSTSCRPVKMLHALFLLQSLRRSPRVNFSVYWFCTTTPTLLDPVCA